ncbi:hypothetical protein FPV67DRAFT_1695098 [Lyophyllum atratum]|nr:hypothetical protein FPV67DRAFT_1695098 [Lyophyllum atratum]
MSVLSLYVNLLLIPRCFAMGTAQKGYTTATVDRSDYDDEVEPRDSTYIPNQHDLKRAKKEPFEYLLRQTKPGELCAAPRGKQLVMAAGHHCVTISFGLEASLLEMSRKDFDELFANDCPGPNKDRSKSEKLRQFEMPPHFIEPGTSPNTKRYVRMFLAFVSDHSAWVLMDFARLVRFHVWSRTVPFAPHEFKPEAKPWIQMWKPYESGPDWESERELCLGNLDRWRGAVLSDDKFASKPILQSIEQNDYHAFNGLGRHLTNDFLHEAGGVFPGAPIIFICESQTTFDSFKAILITYMTQWSSKAYLKLCGGRVNSKNPFSFQAKADANYSTHYLRIFRKAYTQMPSAHYNRMAHAGLFDKDHIIGADYVARGSDILSELQTSAFVPIFHHLAPLDAYTVITAKVPEGWLDGESVEPKDVRTEGYKTTLGPANFHEPKANMLNVQAAAAVKGKPGRKKKVNSGLPGRPRQEPSIASVRKAAAAIDRITVMSQQLREKRSLAKVYGDQEDSDQERKSSSSVLPLRRTRSQAGLSENLEAEPVLGKRGRRSS